MSKTKTKSTAKSKASKPSKRDSKGRFSPGCPGGPGRGPAEKELSYLRRLRQTISVDEFEKVIRKVLKTALSGNLKAAELLCRYCLPTPTETHIVDSSFIDVASLQDEEFRTAGISKSTLDRKMIALAEKHVEQRERLDRQLAASRNPSMN